MIAACLICKNSAPTIEGTLNAIRPWVDEINIFDTGSTDGTIALLRRMAKEKSVLLRVGSGAEIEGSDRTLPHDAPIDAPGTDTDNAILPEEQTVRVPLAPIRVKRGKDIPVTEDTVDEEGNVVPGGLADFSWAREQSFKMASKEHDWFFWCDDDDLVIGAPNLRSLATMAHPACDGYVMFYDYAQDEYGNNICALWRERLIRRNSDFHWVNAVHEVWIPKGESGRGPNYITLPPNQLQFKHQRPPDRYPPTRNLKILERVIAAAAAKGEEPDLRTKAYMGTELMSHGRFEEAIPWLEQYITTPGCPIGDERSQVFHKLSLSLRQTGQAEQALNAEFAAIKERDDWGENAVGLCELFALAGQHERAYIWGKRALELGQPQSMLILNPLEFSFVPYVRLSEACAASGRHQEAQEWLSRAAAIQPNHPLIADHIQRFAQAQQTDMIVNAILTLRETLVRHDENLKAHHLLENVPYIVAEDPRIVSAKAMQREDVMHALKPEEYTRWYEDEPKESTVPDEWVPEAGQYIERAQFLLEQAQEFEAEHGRKPRMLDLGCNDAWMAGFLWVKGQFVCDGIELNKGSVEKAKGRVERFEIPGVVIQGNIFDAVKLLATQAPGGKWAMDDDGDLDRWRYDAPGYDIVSCFEVYEHVPDTDKLLELMESLLTPEGIACLTTPNGAFEQGNIAMWNIVERKGHLRAVPAHELAKQLVSRGELAALRIHAGDRLTYAAYKPKAKNGKVVFWGGPAWEPWSPMSIFEGGLGGSETALSVVSSRLAMDGYDVRVYTDASPGLYGGAVWRPAAAFDPTEEADAIIVMRNPAVFDVELHAPVRALWCHDHSYDGAMTKQRVERMTHVVTLSNWERKRFLARYGDLGLTEEKSLLIRNGIFFNDGMHQPNYPKVSPNFDERKPRVVYASSADRGLDVLLELWPEIRKGAPDAELHVFYGWDIFDRVATVNPALMAYKAQVMELYEAAGGEEGGIFMRGRVGQEELRNEMLQARVWGYPTHFLETSCIVAMEARAAGLACVTSNLGALAETVGEHGILLDPGRKSDEPDFADPRAYGGVFVKDVIRLLTNEEVWTSWHDAALEKVDTLDWGLRVEEWKRLIHSTKKAAAAGSGKLLAGVAA